MTPEISATNQHIPADGAKRNLVPARFQLHVLLFEQKHPLLAGEAAPEPLLPFASIMLMDLLSAAEIPCYAPAGDRIVAKTVDVEQTILLIHHIQLLVQGFSKPLSDSLLHPGMIVVPDGIQTASLAAMETYVSRKPAARLVLLSDELHAEALAIPGLKFRQFAGQPGMNGCWELISPGWLERTMPAPKTARARAADPGSIEAASLGHPPAMSFSSRAIALWPPRPISAVSVAAALVLALLGAVALARSGISRTPVTMPPSAERKPPPASAPALPAPSPQPAPADKPYAPTRVDATPGPALEKKKHPTETPPPQPPPPEAPHAGGLGAAELQILLNKAERSAGDGDYDQAINYYHFILKRDPKNAEALHGLARAEQNRGGSARR